MIRSFSLRSDRPGTFDGYRPVLTIDSRSTKIVTPSDEEIQDEDEYPDVFSVRRIIKDLFLGMSIDGIPLVELNGEDLDTEDLVKNLVEEECSFLELSISSTYILEVIAKQVLTCLKKIHDSDDSQKEEKLLQGFTYFTVILDLLLKFDPYIFYFQNEHSSGGQSRPSRFSPEYQFRTDINRKILMSLLISESFSFPDIFSNSLDIFYFH